ncbi:MAG: hypothetical protein ACI9YU_000338 [Flavobacteriales bacterium]|jgi:hypothetical protein
MLIRGNRNSSNHCIFCNIESNDGLNLRAMTTEQLGHIIKETLVRHRFVVLPEVGAFLLRKLPARIHSIHDCIEPPKDEVRFNEAIKDNDGLLVSSITKQGKTHSDAELELKSLIAKIEFDLAQKAPVDFGPLGVLKKNFDGNLIFTEAVSTDVWPSHFGLRTVQLKPLEVEKSVTIKQLVPSGKKLAIELPVKKALGYAAALALMVSLGIVPMTNENNRNMASLSFASFLGSPVESSYTPRSFQPLEVSASYISEKPILVSEKPAASVKKEVATEAKIEASEFFVIAGAFSSKSNATKLIIDLNSRGFGGLYVGKFDNKHLVSYGSYSSLSDARGMKASVQLGNPDAWVLAGR